MIIKNIGRGLEGWENPDSLPDLPDPAENRTKMPTYLPMTHCQTVSFFNIGMNTSRC